MATLPISDLNGGVKLTNPASNDLLVVTDVSDTTESPDGTTKPMEMGEVIAENLRESSGPTALAIGAVTDGEFLKRVGATVVSAVPTGTGIGGSTGSTDNAVLRANGTGGSTAQSSAAIIDDDGSIVLPEMAAPSTPAAGKVAIYPKSDGKLYIKDDAGTETDLTATGAGGAEAGANSDITSMDGLTGALETVTRIDFAEGAAPSTPGTGEVSLYAKSDGLLYSKDDAGTETLVSGGAGGGSIAPLEIVDANTVRQINGANAQTFQIFQNATIKYEFNSAALLPPTGAPDLGGTSNRWGVAYANQFNAAAGGQFRFNGRAIIEDIADGWVVYKANSGTTAKISFGDTAATAAMLKRSGTALETRLGDDSDYSNHVAAGFKAAEVAANPSASDLTSGANAKDRVQMYMKADKLVFAYNAAGTVTYLSIPLDGSTTTWTHSTSAP